MAKRRRRGLSRRTGYILTGAVALIVGYYAATQFSPVFGLPAPVACFPVPCTPVACTGIGGMTADIIVGDTITPTTDPVGIPTF